MFDEHRKFRSCIFCGSTGKLTKEHMFGASLADWFGPTPNWEVGETVFGPTLKKGSGPILNRAPRLACGPCNHGDLSGDMENSLELLKKLIRGTRHTLSQADRKAVSRYFERIAVIADVMTSNYQMTPEYKAKSKEYELSMEDRMASPLYSDKERKLWRQGKPPPDMRVYIGFHDGVLGLNPFVNMAHARVVLQFGSIRYKRTLGKRFVMVVGKLVVCVCMGQDNTLPPIPASMRNLAVDQNWDWPDATPVSYANVFSLCAPEEDKLVASRAMSKPGLRRKVEKYSRKVGSMTFPRDTLAEVAKIRETLKKEKGS